MCSFADAWKKDLTFPYIHHLVLTIQDNSVISLGGCCLFCMKQLVFLFVLKPSMKSEVYSELDLFSGLLPVEKALL